MIDARDLDHCDLLRILQVNRRQAVLVEEADLVAAPTECVSGVIEEGGNRDLAASNHFAARDRDNAETPILSGAPDRQQSRAIGQAHADRGAIDRMIERDRHLAEPADIGRERYRRAERGHDGNEAKDSPGRTQIRLPRWSGFVDDGPDAYVAASRKQCISIVAEWD